MLPCSIIKRFKTFYKMLGSILYPSGKKRTVINVYVSQILRLFCYNSEWLNLATLFCYNSELLNLFKYLPILFHLESCMDSMPTVCNHTLISRNLAMYATRKVCWIVISQKPHHVCNKKVCWIFISKNLTVTMYAIRNVCRIFISENLAIMCIKKNGKVTHQIILYIGFLDLL